MLLLFELNLWKSATDRLTAVGRMAFSTEEKRDHPLVRQLLPQFQLGKLPVESVDFLGGEVSHK
jgi:hypothetical protein